MSKKINIKYKKERAVLSDVLPYETPVTFSNKYFYNFLITNNIEYTGSNIRWLKGDPALDEVIKLIFGLDRDIETEDANYDGETIQYNTFKDFDPRSFMSSIPFGYNISHKENRYRELVVCHPRNQLQIVNFYDEYKELILYYCNISPFSIRKPNSITKCFIYRDKSHYEMFSDGEGKIEEYGKEYENIRSFFVYKDYSNIYKFFESFKYHRCEKKYNKLLKIDISKCFDSIYTHSVDWAILGKDSVKEQLIKSSSPIEKTFSGRFDKLMQQLNYNETNGIIIGPEFSRIFAELILQSVDRDLYLKLSNKHNLYHNKDYEIYRYVDDYFVFYNDETSKDIILETLQFSLKIYKLYLNPDKEVIYEKPIITEITVAKNKIVNLFNEKIKYDIETYESEGVTLKKGSIYINQNHMITAFKTIIKESGVKYKDILNYSLSIVERKVSRLIKGYLSIEKESNTEKHFTGAILGVLEFIFFIYSVSPRVNTTLKLCRILNLITSFFKSKNINYDHRHIVFKVIYDNICFLLKKNKNTEHTQVETLYLLVLLHELGRDYWLDQSMLCEYFNIDEKNNYDIKMELNYFSITVLLYYMKNKCRYANIRSAVESHVLKRFTKRKKLLMKDSELTLLLLDILTCPYVSNATKTKLLEIYGIDDTSMQSSIITFRPYWFTKWSNFNFGKELDAKRSHEVY